MDSEVLLIPLLTALMQAVKQVPWLKVEGRQWILPFIAITIGCHIGGNNSSTRLDSNSSINRIYIC